MAPFPSEKARNEFDQAHCGDPADATGEVWITYEPTTDSWKTGDRTVECWVASALPLRVRDGCSATRPLRRKPRYRALARGRVTEERCANTLDTRY